MSIPIQVVPAALEPAAEVADDSPSTNQRHDRTLHSTEEDDLDDHFDPERTVCQTASASSSLYKEDVFNHGLHPGHHHSHGDLFPDTALDQLAEIDEKEWERKASTARRRSSAANCTRPKKADLVEAGEGKEARKEVPSDEEKGVKKEDWTYPDGGLKAWLVVLGCFLVAGGGMGFGLTWGVFQSYYVSNPRSSLFGVDESIVTLVGGLCAFTMNATAFFGGRLGDILGYKRALAIGLVLSFLSFFLMAWGTENLWSVFLLQGFLNGFCLGFAQPIAMSLPSQWFLKRRGLATGIATSGAGIFGGMSSIFVRLLIVRLGPRYTLIIYSFIHGVVYIIAYSLIEVRPPPPKRKANGKIDRPWLPRGVWGRLTWYSFIASVFVSVFGFTTPYFFVTSYTRHAVPELANSSTLKVSGPLFVMNFVGGIGRIFAGWVADRVGPVNCFFSALMLGGLFQICVWQFAHTYPQIMAFSLLYGSVGGWFLSLLPVVAAQLFGPHNLATIVGFATLCNAPGQFAAGSIGGALKERFDWQALILFSGCAMSGGSTLILYARFKANKKLWAKV